MSISILTWRPSVSHSYCAQPMVTSPAGTFELDPDLAITRPAFMNSARAVVHGENILDNCLLCIGGITTLQTVEGIQDAPSPSVELPPWQ